MTLSTRARPLDALVGLVRARGNFNRYVAQDARARSNRPPTELVADLRRVAAVRHHPPGTKPVDPLVDVLVHAQDIARPLGIEHHVPAEGAVAAADHVWSMSFPFHARRCCAGVRLRAVDAEWDRGDPAGAEASGPIADVLLCSRGERTGCVDSPVRVSTCWRVDSLLAEPGIANPPLGALLTTGQPSRVTH